MSPSRFAVHALNDRGLHVLRAVLAERLRDARLDAYAPPGTADVLAAWKADGVLVRDFDAIGGDAGLYDLLKIVAAEPEAAVPPPPYAWSNRNVTYLPGDAQSDAHVDSIATVVKVDSSSAASG